MAYVKQEWKNQNEPDAIPINKEHLNHIEEGIANSQAVYLIAVTDEAPTQCNVGDEYYDTEDNLIYTATDTNTWSEVGREALTNVFYVVLSENANYVYDGTTLVSVGAGGGGVTGDTLPIGTIMPYASEEVPTGYLKCNGQAVSRTQYSKLFNAIGTYFGMGDGETTFNVPDLKGRTIIGMGLGIDKNNEYGGSENIGTKLGEYSHTLTINEMPSHNHKVDAGVSLNIANVAYTAITGNLDYSNTGASSIKNTGGGQSHNNTQPSLVVNYIIKAEQSAGVVGNVTNNYSESETDTYSCNYINGDVLYEDETGTNTSIPITGLTNYETLEVFFEIVFGDGKKNCSSRKNLCVQNHKIILDQMIPYSNSLGIYMAGKYLIEPNQLTYEQGIYVRYEGSGVSVSSFTSSTQLKITKVVGYK